MTFMQRILRPVLNFMVERYFPKGAFYGHDFFRAFEEAEIDHAPSATTAAGCLLISAMSKDYQTEMIITVEGITLNGEPKGDWRLIVEEIKEEKEEKADV